MITLRLPEIHITFEKVHWSSSNSVIFKTDHSGSVFVFHYRKDRTNWNCTNEIVHLDLDFPAKIQNLRHSFINTIFSEIDFNLYLVDADFLAASSWSLHTINWKIVLTQKKIAKTLLLF